MANFLGLVAFYGLIAAQFLAVVGMRQYGSNGGPGQAEPSREDANLGHPQTRHVPVAQGDSCRVWIQTLADMFLKRISTNIFVQPVHLFTPRVPSV